MLQALHAEWQKARRRHDLVLCLAFAVILYLWLGSTAPTGQDELANAYSALFYGVPIINTILLPVLMAVLASRLWDVEVKGCTAKLLYTLQSRRSLFFGKAVFGLGEIVLMVALEAAVLLLLGHTQGYTEAFPAGQFAYLNLCTLTVCTMLFGAAAGAVVQQSPACGMHGRHRCAAGSVLGFYAADRQLFCALGLLCAAVQLRGQGLGPGQPHRTLRHAALQLGAVGIYLWAGGLFVWRLLARNVQ